MFKASCFAVVACILLGVASVSADETGHGSSSHSSEQLAHLLPNLYGESGLSVDSEAALPGGGTHSAHFNSAFQEAFTQFNVSIASELSALPLPSPASGFTYEFDPSTGTFTRSTSSFGPILAERAETIGKGKWALGASVQHFSFDEIEGQDLGSLPAVFTHDGSELGGGRADIVTALTSIDAEVTQFATFITYGLTNRLDVSLAIPMLDAQLDLMSVATVQRIGTVNTNPACDPPTPDCLLVHFYDDDGKSGDSKTFRSSGSASGIGDMIIRLKGTAVKNEHAGVALGIDLRLPTGDEEELLGTGALGLKPFVAISFPHAKGATHLNLGYQWNDDSVLAGDVVHGIKGDLPDQVFYAVGVDLGLSERVTLALDFLGQSVIDSPQLVRSTFSAADGSTFEDIDFVEKTFFTSRASVGVKVKAGKVLLSFNGLFNLGDHGLTDDFTPLFGLEYAF